MTNNPNSSQTVKQRWNHEKTKEKLQDIFNLKMFRYTLIKMLKSPSTYVMFILTFLLDLIMVISIAANIIRDPRDWTVTISENYVLYSWIFCIMVSCKLSATNQLRKELIFYWKETLFYFVVLSN